MQVESYQDPGRWQLMSNSFPSRPLQPFLPDQALDAPCLTLRIGPDILGIVNKVTNRLMSALAYISLFALHDESSRRNPGVHGYHVREGCTSFGI